MEFLNRKYGGLSLNNSMAPKSLAQPHARFSFEGTDVKMSESRKEASKFPGLI